MTIKQDKFVKEYIGNGGNGTKAALAVYDTNDYATAHSIASENLQKPSIKKRVDEALVKLRLTPEYVLNKHKNIAEKQEDKDPMIGERALENIGKIAGMYPSSSNSVDIGDGHIKINWE